MSSLQHQKHGSNLEVDPAVLQDLGADSYDSSGFVTSTQSLTSSVNAYVFENGRRYHTYYGADKNHMPTDEKEQDRLDMHHEIMLQLLQGKLHLAPIGDSPQRILDIGTGTGIWVVDCADTYPSAEVIGTDLSPIQPSWVPRNLKFEIDDMDQDWSYQNDSFDFIHIRNLPQSVQNWGKLLKEVYRCLKPGGYVEVAEVEFKILSDDDTAGYWFSRFADLLDESCDKLQRPTVTAEMARDILETAKFEDVKVAKLKQPFGPWPKDERMKKIGAMVLLTADAGTEAYGLAMFTRVLGMSTEDSLEVCRKASAEIKNKNHHVWQPFNVAHGRKPSNAPKRS